MEEITVLSKNAKTVKVKQGKNHRRLYSHQVEAITELNLFNKRDSFNTLLVLPTGAGKTMTATTWLLPAAIDKRKKILWIAHRHLLLEQAADSFAVNAYSELLLNRTSFKYRIISGQHDYPNRIKQDDDILLISKDSIVRNMQTLDKWLADEDELYLVIDEAHHAIAKSYRRIIDYIKAKLANVKMLGLTATPFRTSKQEKGLLGQIFNDDIVYDVDLNTLIKRRILSTPICESCDTDIMLGDELGLNAIKSIQQLDVIPEDIAKYIADNKTRNYFIVKTYFENDKYKKYGQTLVFALSRIHAITLKALFEEYGKKHGINIKAGVIITGTQAEFIGIDVSNAENERQINAYKNGDIQILINVNILTEGVDLPKTKTVFLTRPTISTVLMTQMIGRALRGEEADGTEEAYIVSFVDNWNNKIAWVNPQTILDGEKPFPEGSYEYKKRIIRIISIEKLEEFARIVNDTVNTMDIENIDFIKRVPLGMYVFTFINDNIEHNYQILVYDNSEQRYIDLIAALPAIFTDFGVSDEVIESEILDAMINQCETAYFDGDMIPPYNRRDIEYLLKYFAQKDAAPLFVRFDEVDRQKVNLTIIAKKIVEKDMRRLEQSEYTNSLWDDEKSLLRVYFGNKYFFKRQLEIEIDKIVGDFPVSGDKDNTIGEEIDLESLSLEELCKIAPETGRKIKDSIYSNAKTSNGQYRCANDKCGKESVHKGLFQIDHITAMAKGGRTTLDNLQLLCRSCNQKKSDCQ